MDAPPHTADGMDHQPAWRTACGGFFPGRREENCWLRVLVLTMVLLFGGGSLLLLAALYALSPAAGTAAEVWLSYQLLAARCLRDESMAVYRALTGRSLMDAQRAVGPHCRTGYPVPGPGRRDPGRSGDGGRKHL